MNIREFRINRKRRAQAFGADDLLDGGGRLIEFVLDDDDVVFAPVLDFAASVLERRPINRKGTLTHRTSSPRSGPKAPAVKGNDQLSEFLNFSNLPTWINIAIFAFGAAIIWNAGSRLVRLVDDLASRTGMGRGLAGVLLLGGIVSLTEISTVSTAAFGGNPLLALNNLLGSESINLFLLAVADPLTGRAALTSFIAKPTMLIQGALVIVLLATVTVAMITGDYLIFGVGIWSTAIFLLCIGALWLSASYEKRKVWIAHDEGLTEGDNAAGGPAAIDEPPGGTFRMLIIRLLGASAVVFAAGFLVSTTGGVIAEQTGLGASFVGFVLVGLSTSLPELSTITAAIRMKRHEMAVGDILGSNVFNLLLIFLTDVVYIGDAVLNFVGPFELTAALLGIVMTGILLLGLLERWDRTIFNMGYDSVALLVVFLGGVALLYTLSGQTG